MNINMKMAVLAVFLVSGGIAWAQQGDVKAGQASYAKACVTCHAPDGAPKDAIAKMLKVEMPHLGATEVQAKTDAELRKYIVEGVGKMRPVKSLTAVQVGDVIAYVRSLATQAQDNEPAERLDEAAAVFSEIMATPDKSIPQELVENAHCIVIVPELKTAAFVVGGKYGKGYLSCRNKSGTGWSAPGTVRIEGGSVGFQIGGSSTDLIMLIMNERGADKLLSSKFTLGVEGSVAAGPVGRTATAQTDAQMHADILSWSRSQGLFAGLALEGATLRQDLDDNATLYGKELENRDIVTQGVSAPKAAAKLITLLNRYSPRESKD
jgi:SH3 domain-containing YSC84-like protein 1